MKKGPVESTKVVYEVNSKSRVKYKPKPTSTRKQRAWSVGDVEDSTLQKMSSMGKELPKMLWTKSFCRNVQDQVSVKN